MIGPGPIEFDAAYHWPHRCTLEGLGSPGKELAVEIHRAKVGDVDEAVVEVRLSKEMQAPFEITSASFHPTWFVDIGPGFSSSYARASLMV